MMDVRRVRVRVFDVCVCDCASFRSASSSLLGNTLGPPCQKGICVLCVHIKVHI